MLSDENTQTHTQGEFEKEKGKQKRREQGTCQAYLMAANEWAQIGHVPGGQ